MVDVPLRLAVHRVAVFWLSHEEKRDGDDKRGHKREYHGRGDKFGGGHEAPFAFAPVLIEPSTGR